MDLTLKELESMQETYIELVESLLYDCRCKSCKKSLKINRGVLSKIETELKIIKNGAKTTKRDL